MSYFKASIYALLTAPLILFNVSHASTYTTGDLEYDPDTGVITNKLTQQAYLGWNHGAYYTYQETVDATAIGGRYADYHIADYEEAKTFFEAAMSGSCVVTSDTNTFCDTQAPYAQNWSSFGDNSFQEEDAVWYWTGDPNAVGWIRMHERTQYQHQFVVESTMTIAETDEYSWSGRYWDEANIAWLMVANTTSTVPVPAAIWLFGTALIGLVGYGKRKSKVPV
ncbi:MAG: hypothetical protein GY814_08895 [Gammaproteobacteria bacterium]|nr:hypothetical protein [Gammaproteobacteria bacterium]